MLHLHWTSGIQSTVCRPRLSSGAESPSRQALHRGGRAWRTGARCHQQPLCPCSQSPLLAPTSQLLSGGTWTRALHQQHGSHGKYMYFHGALP